MADAPDGFLARWSRRKEQVRSAAVAEPESLPVPPPAPAVVVEAAAPVAPEAPPLPTLDDVALLTRESDYSRFVASGVDDGVKRAAMKKLFSDPHFNVMDGLDTYIDDYGKPDPIPLAMLRQMNQSKFLGLFDDEEESEEAARPDPTPAAPPPIELTAAPTEESPHDDPDLRLQQDHDAGRAGAGESARA